MLLLIALICYCEEAIRFTRRLFRSVRSQLRNKDGRHPLASVYAFVLYTWLSFRVCENAYVGTYF